jgi:hypothetical protein
LIQSHFWHQMSRVCGDYIRLTTGFIGSHTVTHNSNYIARERTPKKTPPRNRPQRKHVTCYLPSNGCQQAFPLLTVDLQRARHNMKQFMEWELAGETEAPGENLPQSHFVHHNSYISWLGIEPGSPQWEAGDQPSELWHGVTVFES